MINNVSNNLTNNSKAILRESEPQKDGELENFLFSKIFCNSSTIYPPLMPLKIAKYIYKNHIELYIKTAMYSLHGREYTNIKKEELVTSSLNSIHSLAVIFLGVNQAKAMLGELGTQAHLTLCLRFASGNHWEYKVENLLHGSLASHVNKDPLFNALSNEQKDAKTLEDLKPNIERFFHYLQPFVDQSLLEESEKKSIEKFEGYLSKINYNFNEEVIHSLKIEIYENSLKVNSNTSFFYCVAGIMVPGYREVLAIEQYFCKETGQNRFILYKSEFKKRTMSQWLEQYTDTGINTLTERQLNKFLANLEKTYCQDSLLGTSFPVFYKNRTIYGLSLRYVSAKISPYTCMHNLLNLIKNHSLLKTQIAETGNASVIVKLPKISINDSQTYLEPFGLVKRLAANYWKDFMPAASKILFNGEKYCTQEPISSCIRTCYVVSSLFLGKDRARLVMKNLRKSTSQTWSFPISKETKLSYKIDDLFTGVHLFWINENADNYFKEKKQRTLEENNSIYKHMNEFFKYTQPIIDSVSKKIMNKDIDEGKGLCELDDAISNIGYKFNRATINELQQEIFINNTKINNNQSFLYSIAIGRKIDFDHAVVLVQSRSPFTGETRFRLLQSFIHQADFPEDIAKRGYGDGDEGTWDFQGLLTFIQLLREVYEPNENRSSDSYFKCFGYKEPLEPLISLTKENGKRTLHGLSLRYVSFPFVPSDCIHHLNEMLQTISHEDLYDPSSHKKID